MAPLFAGYSVGYEGQSIGEVVFQHRHGRLSEVLTDPSYYGVVTMTYPLIGNYGINFEDYESRKSWVRALSCARSRSIPPTGAAA